MLLEEYIFAGFGGQGIMTIGQLIAYAGMIQGYDTAWIPSYGPESRGGTANCNVVISDDVIGSPHTHTPNGVIVMNAPSFDRFEPAMRKDGVLIVNSNLVNRKSQRTDIKTVYLPCADAALAVGNAIVASVVALGAFNALKKVVADNNIEKAIRWKLPEKRADLIDLNVRAYYAGKERVEPAEQ